jgi:hypothetical protein
MNPVSITLGNGNVVEGRYSVEKGIVTVTYSGAKKATQLGGSPEIVIAEMLLRELVATS